MNTQPGVFQIDIQQIFSFIYYAVTSGYGVNGIVEFFRTAWDFINFISLFLAPLLFFGVVYAVVRLHQVHKAEHERFHEAVQEAQHGIGKGNEKWQRIVDFVNTDNPTEWRHAVIEADVMLEELLRTLGYQGDSVGELLKAIDKSDFLSLDAAWEAHKVRNSIAHAGGDFQLNERETRRTISLFETVFQEFKII